MTNLTSPRRPPQAVRQTMTGIVLSLVQELPPVPRYLGPRWSRMTPDERRRYGIPGALSPEELDAIWGRSA